MQVTRASLLDYNGPAPEELQQIRLPANLDSMTLDKQQNAKALHRAQTLHNLYLARSCQVNTEPFQAMQGQDTLRHQLAEDVGNEWSKIVGMGPDSLPRIPCPLQFSAAEVQQQIRDEELWAQGVGPMNCFISDTGCFKHWDDRVSDADYELSKRQLAEGIERLLGREARNEEERKEWLKALPFVD
ncbi:Phosphotransferase enzyme family protein [Aspergillus sp. HF37]|nr:Phosphotransferase enzyme family protein [Aspergillus sp. HF37]